MTYRQIDNNTGELKFYGPISEWWNSANDFDTTITEMEKKFTTINIRVHCYGGSVIEGSVIFNRIARSTSEVIVYIDGIAASMMSIVMLAAKKVVMAENSFLMIHAPSGYTEGNADEHFNTGKLLKAMEKNFAKAYARKTGKNESEALKLLNGKDNWYSAEEAKAEKFIDEISEAVAANIEMIDKTFTNEGVERMYARYSAILTTQATSSNITINNLIMKKSLIEAFGIEGVTENSSNEEVITAMKKKIQVLEVSVANNTAAHIETIIANVEANCGSKFDDVQRNSFKAIGEKVGIEALQGALSLVPQKRTPDGSQTQQSAQQVPRIIDMLGGNGNMADTRANWTWDDYQEKAPDALEAMVKNNPENFKALYKKKYGTEPQM